MSRGSRDACWYWPLLILWLVQRPIATNILKTIVSITLYTHYSPCNQGFGDVLFWVRSGSGSFFPGAGSGTGSSSGSGSLEHNFVKHFWSVNNIYKITSNTCMYSVYIINILSFYYRQISKQVPSVQFAWIMKLKLKLKPEPAQPWKNRLQPNTQAPGGSSSETLL